MASRKTGGVLLREEREDAGQPELSMSSTSCRAGFFISSLWERMAGKEQPYKM